MLYNGAMRAEVSFARLLAIGAPLTEKPELVLDAPRAQSIHYADESKDERRRKKDECEVG